MFPYLRAHTATQSTSQCIFSNAAFGFLGLLIVLTHAANAADSLSGAILKGTWNFRGETGEVDMKLGTIGRNEESIVLFDPAPPIPGIKREPLALKFRNQDFGSSAYFSGGIGEDDQGRPCTVGVSIESVPVIDRKIPNEPELCAKATFETSMQFEVALDLKRCDQVPRDTGGAQAGNDLGLEIAQGFEPLTATQAQFPEEIRVAIAKVAHAHALKELASVKLKTKPLDVQFGRRSFMEPTSRVQIEDRAAKLFREQGWYHELDPKYVAMNTWRSIFVTLSEPGKPTIIRYLRSSGIDLTTAAAAAQTAAAALDLIAAREKVIHLGARKSRDLREEDYDLLNSLDTASGRLYAVNCETGDKTEIPADERDLSLTLPRLSKLALTPENIFPDSKTRQAYIDISWAWHREREGLSKDLIGKFDSAFAGLKVWYLAQDTLLNDGLTSEEMLENVANVNEDPVLANRKLYQRHQFLIDGLSGGELPSTERIQRLLKSRASEKVKEKPTPKYL